MNILLFYRSFLAFSITPNGSVKNLAVIFDQCVNMHEQYAELPTTISLKAFLTQEALVTVLHALVNWWYRLL